MRILVVHHGRLPAPGQPASGGAIRAWHLGRGLSLAGHEVHWMARDQDQLGGFASPADLVRKARALQPQAVLCVQLEDAPALAVLDLPLVVDLYAPRLLEAPFEGALASAAPATLAALGAGDVFLVSSARQGWSWLGVLALAGVDVRRDPTLRVPIASAESPRRRWPALPVFVGGGGDWAWADPRPDLAQVLAILDERDAGEVRWFGPAELPEHPRLRRMGTVGWDELIAAYAGATAALDLMQPNPERELALGFRHADYLAAGLPVLTRPGGAVADVLGEAAWSGELPTLLEQVLADHAAGGAELRRRGKAAQKLALARSPLACIQPLLAWLAASRSHRAPKGPLLDLAALSLRAARAEAQAEHAADLMARAETEALAKRAEVAELTGRVQQLSGVVERLSRGIDEVAGFKREAITVLGLRAQGLERGSAEANAQVEALQADVQKKSAEVQDLAGQRARLEEELRLARVERAELDGLRGDLRRLQAELSAGESLRQRLEEYLAAARQEAGRLRRKRWF